MDGRTPASMHSVRHPCTQRQAAASMPRPEGHPGPTASCRTPVHRRGTPASCRGCRMAAGPLAAGSPSCGSKSDRVTKDCRTMGPWPAARGDGRPGRPKDRCASCTGPPASVRALVLRRPRGARRRPSLFRPRCSPCSRISSGCCGVFVRRAVLGGAPRRRRALRFFFHGSCRRGGLGFPLLRSAGAPLPCPGRPPGGHSPGSRTCRSARIILACLHPLPPLHSGPWAVPPGQSQ
jgi:hypothetical protein